MFISLRVRRWLVPTAVLALSWGVAAPAAAKASRVVRARQGGAGRFALAGGQTPPRPLLILLTGTSTSFYVSKGVTPALVTTALVVGLWILRMIRTGSLRLVESGINTPVLGYMGSVVASMAWGNLMVDPLIAQFPGFATVQIAQMVVLVFSPAVLLVTANVTRSAKQIHWLVWSFLLLSTLGLLASLLNLPLQTNTRGLVPMWAISLAYGQALFNHRLSRAIRLLLIVLVGLWLYLTFGLGVTWKTGWVPGLIAIVLLTFLWSRRAFALMLLTSLCAVLLSLSWWQGMFLAEDAESGNRFDKWLFLWEQPSVRGHWLLGTGPFGYARYFMTYFPDNAASTHSNYIDIFLQTGVIGTFFFLWLLWSVGHIAFRQRRATAGQPFLMGFTNSVLAGIVAVMIAMLLGDWFTPFVLNQGLHGYSWTVQSWIFFGAMISLGVWFRPAASLLPATPPD